MRIESSIKSNTFLVSA